VDIAVLLLLFIVGLTWLNYVIWASTFRTEARYQVFTPTEEINMFFSMTLHLFPAGLQSLTLSGATRCDSSLLGPQSTSDGENAQNVRIHA
jgi:hypothetical protein